MTTQETVAHINNITNSFKALRGLDIEGHPEISNALIELIQEPTFHEFCAINQSFNEISELLSGVPMQRGT